MNRTDYTFTSESVSEGHPDKIADRISDEIVDLAYREAAKCDYNPWDIRVAAETLVTTNRVIIAGEVRFPPTLYKTDVNGNQTIDTDKIEKVVREAIKDIGYEQEGFHWKTVQIEILLHAQSPDIAAGVDNPIVMEKIA